MGLGSCDGGTQPWTLQARTDLLMSRGMLKYHKEKPDLGISCMSSAVPGRMLAVPGSPQDMSCLYRLTGTTQKNGILLKMPLHLGHLPLCHSFNLETGSGRWTRVSTQSRCGHVSVPRELSVFMGKLPHLLHLQEQWPSSGSELQDALVPCGDCPPPFDFYFPTPATLFNEREWLPHPDGV